MSLRRILRPKNLLALLVTAAIAGGAVVAVAQSGLPPAKPVVAPAPGYDGAKVSFTFDDGYQSFLTKAAPVLNEFGYSGTAYVTTDHIGTRPGFLSWSQTQALSQHYGWEIGGHSKTHPKMSELSQEQVLYEVRESYQALQDHGFSPVSYAAPFGDYSPEAIAAIAQYYQAHRGFHDTGLNTWPYRDYQLVVEQVQSGVEVDKVKAYIDEARRQNKWLILVFHDISDNPSPLPDHYQYGTDQLRQVARYVSEQGIPVTTVANGLVGQGENLLADGSFSNGLPAAWESDNSNLLVDTGGHGSAPEALHSFKLASSMNTATHLYTRRIPVEQLGYAVKAYVNLAAAGEVNLYVDEYNQTGEWVSGQYFEGTSFGDDKSIGLRYTPSSPSIAFVRLQFINEQTSQADAYIDQVMWLKP